MYPIGNAFKEMLSPEGINRVISWHGNMVTVSGKEYDIETKIIPPGTGKIDGAIQLPFIGKACSTSLRMQLNLSDVDPRTLKNAKISLFVNLKHSIPEQFTWDDADEFTWNEMKSTTWERKEQTVSIDIPMGVFYVAKADRYYNSIKIEAYDGMVKFDADLPAMDTTARSVYGWLRWACNACGVELGMTEEQVKAMPNGTRSFAYAVVNENLKTYRDLLASLSAVIGSVALIDRTGQLVLVYAGISSVADISPDDRFSSEYEDTQHRYTGLRSQYKAKAIQEYYKNVGALEDDGLVIDLNLNPFLQISNSSARTAAIQTIIDAFSNVSFTPFKAEIPCHPEYDLLDIVSFSGGHAPVDCFAPITGITRTINGGVSIRCAEPAEQVNLNRETIQVDGLSGNSYASSDFWIQLDAFPDSETTFSDDTVTTELTVNCTVDNTTMQIAWTGFYSLSTDARVTVKVFVDDTEIYTASEDQNAGNHILNVTTGHTVNTQGMHDIKVFLREDIL